MKKRKKSYNFLFLFLLWNEKIFCNEEEEAKVVPNTPPREKVMQQGVS
jgi:hypothetical protein